MQNCKVTTKGTKVLIELDLDAEGIESKTGKSIVLASTNGNIDVPGAPGVRVGVNMFRLKNAA